MRLFVAVRFSDATEKALGSAMNALRRQGRGNFTRAENLHLTLAFIGEVKSPDAAIAAIGAVRGAPFTMRLEKLGSFGDLYWVGCEKSPQLTALQHEVCACLQKEGVSFDKKPFNPHLTLCRKYIPFTQIQPHFIERALGSPCETVEEIVLMESSRDEKGWLVYTPVYVKKLI
ncbi:MAG: RNA 2',3'-cyclic phosphodiesterase [Oscillospiraceae bacterium]|nr:RNA 2',3'-cyclic phosphodiesterase [Oscillospiraceae bacterium]